MDGELSRDLAGTDKNMETGRANMETAATKIATGNEKMETGRAKIATGNEKMETGRAKIASAGSKDEEHESRAMPSPQRGASACNHFLQGSATTREKPVGEGCLAGSHLFT